MTSTVTPPQCPPYAGDKIELEEITLGRKLTLTEPSVVAFYESKVAADALGKYYKETILPWLKDQRQKNTHDPAAQCAIEIYLIGCILVVVTHINNYQPWEAIPNLADYFVKPDAKRLESPQLQ